MIAVIATLSESATLVLVALIAAVVGPVVLAWVNGRQRRVEKAEDRAREDEVARRVEEVARRAEAATVTTDGKLEGIASDVKIVHTLVNSNLSAAKEESLLSLKERLVTLKEMRALMLTVGGKPTEEIDATIADVEARVESLQAEMRDRLAQESDSKSPPGEAPTAT